MRCVVVKDVAFGGLPLGQSLSQRELQVLTHEVRIRTPVSEGHWGV